MLADVAGSGFMAGIEYVLLGIPIAVGLLIAGLVWVVRSPNRWNRWYYKGKQ